jgi:hypothetical protein
VISGIHDDSSAGLAPSGEGIDDLPGLTTIRSFVEAGIAAGEQHLWRNRIRGDDRYGGSGALPTRVRVTPRSVVRRMSESPKFSGAAFVIGKSGDDVVPAMKMFPLVSAAWP